MVTLMGYEIQGSYALTRDPVEELIERMVGFFERTSESVKDYLKTEGFTALEPGYFQNVLYMGHGSNSGGKNKGRDPAKGWKPRNQKRNKPGHNSTQAHKKGKRRSKNR